MTEKAKDNTVFIGKKPTMAYVLAAMTQFSNGQQDIQIKARGRSISKAVDVAEIVRNRFVQSTKVDSIKIGTETLENERKEKMNVSTIEITLKK
ncbi:MAG TPA: DNA-binding protein Alba [archaeon]|nr:DNA-binding protein Alba [archaeon]